mgnify:CR=1 FL=1
MQSGRFVRLGQDALEGLAASAQPLSYKHGERVWSRGDAGTVAWVVEGALDVLHHDVVIDTLGPGQPLGLSALWGKPHSAEVKARRTERERAPEILLWDVTNEEVLRMLRSPEVLVLLLEDAFGLIHHLNALQVLHRRKCGAAAHVATHLRRLASFRKGDEVEIPQRRRMQRKPTDYLRHIYYDSITYNLGALQYLISVVGESQVMFGTDWPHQVHDVKGAFANTARLPAPQMNAVRSGNATKLFRL